MVTSVFGISAILREVRRGGRGFPPSGTNEFADGYCVSEAMVEILSITHDRL